MSSFGSSSQRSAGSLRKLCDITIKACETISPLIQSMYWHCNGIGSNDAVKLKADASVFTIADGIVQNCFIEHLFKFSTQSPQSFPFNDIVGEEEDCVNVKRKGDVNVYTVNDLVVPEEFVPAIDQCREKFLHLSKEIDMTDYKDLTVFIDPIDGTREFSTGKGEQCSICIGFNDQKGKPVAGVVYRPIDNTYAAGAKEESYYDARLQMATSINRKGFLTSNGGISPFIAKLIDELGYTRVKAGGAGNKMLMLLEGKGAVYIQDRGVSRWDTSAAQAVLEASGGVLSKLSKFVKSDGKELESYTYLKSIDGLNLDYEVDTAELTSFNCVDNGNFCKEDFGRKGKHEEFKSYANLCGLFAASKSSLNDLPMINDCIKKVEESNLSLSYN